MIKGYKLVTSTSTIVYCADASIVRQAQADGLLGEVQKHGAMIGYDIRARRPVAVVCVGADIYVKYGR
jgi:hypothetical protein